MAAPRTQTASSFKSRYTYQVFLSFSSKDTGTTFSDHLHAALERVGIHTFRADDELERGEDMESELQRAFKESRILAIVFSESYASSEHCLDELVKVNLCRKTGGHKFLPIYYKVDPSEVGKQRGCFGEAFATLEKQLVAETSERTKELMEKVESWRTTLKEVANLRGMVLENQSDGHEAKFIQEIVKEIQIKLKRKVLSVAQYQVGIDSLVKKINSWLQDGASDVGIGVISGLGGIGKTNIAKVVYNLNFDRFERSSFIADIRETSKQPDGLVCLQQQLLSDILKGKRQKVCSVDKGTTKIEHAVSCKTVLLVLDDVDQLDQLNAVIGMGDWFYSGSKIIITTRYEHLLKSYKVHEFYKVKELDNNESLQLFSWHAFKQGHPVEGFMEHSKSIINHCRGLPLALQLLGSSLCGKTMEEWEIALEKMDRVTGNQILEKLAMSYMSLQDDHDKKLFLHIASFFIGKDKEYVINVLDECDFCTTVGIENLKDRGLITIGEGNKLMMHQLLQDMARKIIHDESPEDPGKRSILCDHMDSFHVLNGKTGTEKVQGLILNMNMLKKDESSMMTFNLSRTKRLPGQGTSDGSILPCQSNSWKRQRLGLFSWQPITNALTGVFLMPKAVNIKTDAFANMHKLRLLKLNLVQLSGSYRVFPKKLRWLCWSEFPLKSIPSGFPLESLVALELCNSRLEQVWKGKKFLGSLKFLNLSYCHSLIKTPDFSGLPYLERLLLKDCTSLAEVHDSVGDLENLLVLNLKGCKNLRTLPRNIGQLKSLEKLILAGCSKLEMLPKKPEKLKPLTVLHTCGTAICQSYAGIDSWSKTLRSWLSTQSTNVNPSLGFFPCTLRKLSLRDCNLSDDAIPTDLSALSLLLELNLSQNSISSLPDSIRGLTMLKSLLLDTCTRLHSLPKLPPTLKELSVRDCKSLERMIIPPNLLKSLDVMHLTGCDKLVKIDGLFRLEPIGNFNPEIINNLGLLGLGYKGQTEMELCNNLTFARKKYPLQGLYEFGIISTFLPGSMVPYWFRIKSFDSKMSFAVPAFPNLRIKGFDVCVVYACSDPHNDGKLHDFHLKIGNKTKGLEWTYAPMFHTNGDTVWISHWNLTDQLHAGDELNVSVVTGVGFQVKECATEFVLEQVDEFSQSNSGQEVIQGCEFPYQSVLDGDLSEYQSTKGMYILCNYNQHPDVHFSSEPFG
ncbi:disease resistance protein RUN1-like [Diospyros lotus]|uniref:disease resistance protein RUN1-like n=1 Tax=Diospyros lotus TaxID=55363 RepID=UPI0022505C00|nr:disease resistance protein RUN1-like [Diospyros lotus]XP_052194674.1 disease resistance protein RUN1-like [Diospyros lotus]XP_052194675.1 disease resistance protein RUN1-like [Diospyros lotus]